MAITTAAVRRSLAHLRGEHRWEPIASIAAISLCTMASMAGPAPSFAERSARVGLTGVHEPLGHGSLPHVIGQMTGGAAVGDFDRDGDPDVFVLGGGEQPDRLYQNSGGVFTDKAAAWGVNALHIGISASVGDYDDDGWLDIFVVSFGLPSGPSDPANDHHRLYRNNGDGTFTDVADAAGLRTFGGSAPQGWGSTFGDYDLDGDLDLAVASWTNGGTRLFRNNGDGTFTDRSFGAGIQTSSPQGFSPAFVDMDGDLYPELLVACDFGGSQYFRNDRDGTFTEITADAGVGLDGNGMGHVIADFDGDGRQDWYVTSIHSDHPFPPNIPGTGNYLYTQAGAHAYDVQSNGVTGDGGWGWGVEAIDVDHDGRLDLVETNGWRGVNAAGEFEWTGESGHVYRNLGGGKWENIASQCGFTWDGMGRGLIRLDADRDGDQDVIVIANGEPMRFFRNEMLHGADARWIDVRLTTDAHPRLAPDGVGAKVSVLTSGVWQHRVMSGQCTFAGQSELSVHFGLAGAKLIDELRVQWTDGSVTRLTDLEVDRHVVIESGLASDLDADGTVGFFDLLTVLSRFTPVAEDRSDPADLDRDGSIDVRDLLIVMGNWGVSS